MDNQCGNVVGKIHSLDLNKEFPLSSMNNKPEFQPSTQLVSFKRESLRSLRLNKERAEIQGLRIHVIGNNVNIESVMIK